MDPGRLALSIEPLTGSPGLQSLGSGSWIMDLGWYVLLTAGSSDLGSKKLMAGSSDLG